MKPVLLVAVLLVFNWAACAQPTCLTINTYLPDGFTGTPYSQVLGFVGQQFTSGPIIWSLRTGALPTGLSLSSSGVISGVPATAWTSIFTIWVSAPDSGACDGYQTFTLVVRPGPPGLVIATATLPAGFRGNGYSASLEAIGGAPPYTWSITSGALPSGLSLVPGTTGTVPTATASIQGTPTTAAVTSTFTVKVTDSTSATASQTFTLAIAISPLTVTTSSTLPVAHVGLPYSQNLTASGGASPYTWSLTGGVLPTGLTLSPAGEIAGVPTTSGTALFRVSATDASLQSGSAVFTLTTLIPPLTISSPSALPSGVAGAFYSQTLTAISGVPPYRWQVSSGALPPLLTLSPDGVIAGIVVCGSEHSGKLSIFDKSDLSLLRTIDTGISISCWGVGWDGRYIWAVYGTPTAPYPTGKAAKVSLTGVVEIVEFPPGLENPNEFHTDGTSYYFSFFYFDSAPGKICAATGSSRFISSQSVFSCSIGIPFWNGAKPGIVNAIIQLGAGGAVEVLTGAAFPPTTLIAREAAPTGVDGGTRTLTFPVLANGWTEIVVTAGTPVVVQAMCSC